MKLNEVSEMLESYSFNKMNETKFKGLLCLFLFSSLSFFPNLTLLRKRKIYDMLPCFGQQETVVLTSARGVH